MTTTSGQHGDDQREDAPDPSSAAPSAPASGGPPPAAPAQPGGPPVHPGGPPVHPGGPPVHPGGPVHAAGPSDHFGAPLEHPVAPLADAAQPAASPAGGPAAFGGPPAPTLAETIPPSQSGRPGQLSSAAPMPPPAARVATEPRFGPVRNAAIAAAATVLLFLPGLASDLLAGILSDSEPLSGVMGVLNVGLLLLVVWAVSRYLERRRGHERTRDADLVAPGPPLRPAWFRTPPDLHGTRVDELRAAVERVLAHGMVAVVGRSGSGSSAVAEAVVHELRTRLVLDPAWATPFDLRGWSTQTPDDPPTIASYLLSTFGAAAPAHADAAMLTSAARRLRGLMSHRPSVLLLDNVTRAEQISWLVDEWRGADEPPPYLVVAGRPEIAVAFPAGCVVELQALDRDDLQQIWRQAGGDPAAFALETAADLHAVLDACEGRPGAVRDLARESTRQPPTPWSPGELVTFLTAASGVASRPPVDPRERVWTAILTRTRSSMSRLAWMLACALAQLPLAELTVEAMEAVRTGLDHLVKQFDTQDADLGIPTPTTEPVVVVDPIQELLGRALIRRTAVGRYRMPWEVRRAVLAILSVGEPGYTTHAQRRDERGQVVQAALSALLSRYADLAERWGLLLDDTEHAGSAARWFQVEEPLLRALLTGRYPRQDAQGTSTSSTDDALLSLVIDDLARLADTLDVWYARQQTVAGAQLVHTSMLALAHRAGRPDLAELATIRLASVWRTSGDLRGAEVALDSVTATAARRGRRMPGDRLRDRLLRRRRTTAALDARRHHERSLIHLAQADATSDPAAMADELAAADLELQRAWSRLAGRDVRGEVTTLLTMAVVYLRQGLAERALDRLDLAESRAQDSDDTHGLAHVAELRGVAEWMRGRAPVAAALWQRALTSFGDLSDQQGEARCLQHLGSAVLVAPELAGLLVDSTRRPVDEVGAIQYARAWLERSSRLRAGHRPPAVAVEYLELARARTARPTETGEPPSDLTDIVPARVSPRHLGPTGVARRIVREVRRWLRS